MAVFEDFGNEVLSSVTGIATGTSEVLIGNLQTPVLTALTVYFMIKGYLIMAGRITDALPDFMLTAGKIMIVSYLGFNTLGYLNIVLPFIRGCEELLVSSIRLTGASVTTNNPWAAIDELWANMTMGNDAVASLWSQFSMLSNPGETILIGVLWVAMGLISIMLTAAAIGVLLINEVCLSLALAFGPLFFCCLFFPITRSWFDGWIKSVATYVFVMVLFSAVLILVCSYYNRYVTEIIQTTDAFSKTQSMANIWVPVLSFLVVAVVSFQIVKMVPAIAAGLVGGGRMDAVGLGAMLSGMTQSTRALTGAGLRGMGAGTGSTALQEKGARLMGHDQYRTPGSGGMFVAGAALGGIGHAAASVYNKARGNRAVQAAQTADFGGGPGSGSPSSTPGTPGGGGSAPAGSSFSGSTARGSNLSDAAAAAATSTAAAGSTSQGTAAESATSAASPAAAFAGASMSGGAASSGASVTSAATAAGRMENANFTYQSQTEGGTSGTGHYAAQHASQPASAQSTNYVMSPTSAPSQAQTSTTRIGQAQAPGPATPSGSSRTVEHLASGNATAASAPSGAGTPSEPSSSYSPNVSKLGSSTYVPSGETPEDTIARLNAETIRKFLNKGNS